VLQSNHVQNIAPLAGLTNLSWTLDLSANEIADLSPITNLHSLTWLGISQNQLTTLPSLIGLPGLTSLDLWGNQLTNVAAVSGMTQLTWLGLSRNNLSALPVLSGLPNLNSLDLYTNHITDVSGLAGLLSLHWLNLNDNDLQDIHPLTGLTNLYYVDLRFNLLNTNLASAAMIDIGLMQPHTYVDYIPQRSASGPPVVLSAATWLGGNQFRFTLQSAPGAVVQIWTSPDLTAWAPQGFITNTTGTTNVTDTAAVGAKRFYRASKL
jgi:hypothetical protein